MDNLHTLSTDQITLFHRKAAQITGGEVVTFDLWCCEYIRRGGRVGGMI